jgi:hypothetical protein
MSGSSNELCALPQVSSSAAYGCSAEAWRISGNRHGRKPACFSVLLSAQGAVLVLVPMLAAMHQLAYETVDPFAALDYSNCLAKTRSRTRAASKTSGCDELRVYGVIKTWDQGSGHQFDFYCANHDSKVGARSK